MKKYEYKRERFDTAVGELTKLGLEGWRVVPGIFDGALVLMEREVSEKPVKSAMGFTGP